MLRAGAAEGCRNYKTRQAARPAVSLVQSTPSHAPGRVRAGRGGCCCCWSWLERDGFTRDGFTRDPSGALARATVSRNGGCNAILMQWWDLLLLWWHRNTARSVVSTAIKFAGSGYGRIEPVRVTVPAARQFF